MKLLKPSIFISLLVEFKTSYNSSAFKLASKYYDDPTMWWVIAFYNQKPTEFHLKLGDLVYIPVPLETVLFYIGYKIKKCQHAIHLKLARKIKR